VRASETADINEGYENERKKLQKSTSDKEWRERKDAFMHELKKIGWKLQNVDGDGACMFRAVAVQIYFDEEMHDLIRQKAMDYIAQNKEKFEEFIIGDIATYIKRKRNPREWGNSIEIEAISAVFNRRIEVYQYETLPFAIYNEDCENVIKLSYEKASHYNAILVEEQSKSQEFEINEIETAINVDKQCLICSTRIPLNYGLTCHECIEIENEKDIEAFANVVDAFVDFYENIKNDKEYSWSEKTLERVKDSNTLFSFILRSSSENMKIPLSESEAEETSQHVKKAPHRQKATIAIGYDKYDTVDEIERKKLVYCHQLYESSFQTESQPLGKF
jgi:hypothetical protein